MGKLWRAEFNMIIILDPTSSRLFSKGIWHTSSSSCLNLPPSSIELEFWSNCWYKNTIMIGRSKCITMIRRWLSKVPNQFGWFFIINFHHNFRLIKLSKSANGALSLQMVGDVRLCFYYNTRPISITKAPFKDLLLLIDHSIQGVGVGNWEQLSTHTDYKAQVRRLGHIWTAKELLFSSIL